MQTLVRVFGFTPGCVGPIGLRLQSSIQVVLNTNLMQAQRLLCGAGELDVVFSIDPKRLQQVVTAHVADIAKA